MIFGKSDYEKYRAFQDKASRETNRWGMTKRFLWFPEMMIDGKIAWLHTVYTLKYRYHVTCWTLLDPICRTNYYEPWGPHDRDKNQK